MNVDFLDLLFFHVNGFPSTAPPSLENVDVFFTPAIDYWIFLEKEIHVKSSIWLEPL